MCVCVCMYVASAHRALYGKRGLTSNQPVGNTLTALQSNTEYKPKLRINFEEILANVETRVHQHHISDYSSDVLAPVTG